MVEDSRDAVLKLIRGCPWEVFSGGVDSSLISAIIAKKVRHLQSAKDES
jgi:asparagine synthetase B (glutamine-hydrolysing)